MNNNSGLPYSKSTLKDLGEALGIPIFEGASGYSLFLNGFIINGGKVSISTATGESTISFTSPYTKQLLGIFIQGIHSTGAVGGNVKTGSESLTSFTIVNAADAKDFYWWSIGV